jgi:hypothetical protein
MNTRETEREISVVENTRMRIHWFVERKREKVDLRREWRNGGGDDEIEWNEREYIPFWRKRFFIFIYTKEGKCQIATLISSRTRNRLLSCGVVLVGSFLFVTCGELLLPNVLLMQASLVFAISITSLQHAPYVKENNTFCFCSLILICSVYSGVARIDSECVELILTYLISQK